MVKTKIRFIDIIYCLAIIGADIFTTVISTGDTYVFDPKTAKEALHKHWFADYMETFVAVDDKDEILGTYIIKPNQIDLSDHIANFY